MRESCSHEEGKSSSRFSSSKIEVWLGEETDSWAAEDEMLGRSNDVAGERPLSLSVTEASVSRGILEPPNLKLVILES